MLRGNKGQKYVFTTIILVVGFLNYSYVGPDYPILWPPDVKSWLIGKDPDAGKDWRQEKGETEDNMVHSITDSMDINLSKLWETVEDTGAWYVVVRGVAKELDTI